MTPLAIIVPVVLGGGAIAYYLLTKKDDAIYTPPPGAQAITSGGTRAQQYLKQLSNANTAVSIAKIAGGDTLKSAIAESKATLDVVKNMANADLVAGRITQLDMTNINNQIAILNRTMA